MVTASTRHRLSNGATQKLEELRSSLSKLIEHTEKLAAKIEELEVEKEQQNYRGLNFETLRNALCNLSTSADLRWIPKSLGTMGSGPWDESEFDEFLAERDIQPHSIPNEELNGLVLGANEWDADDLAEQIYDRTAKTLRVYTQELFVFGLIAGQDPYDLLEQEVIEEIGTAHPAIQFILNQAFSWPWANQDEDEDEEEIDWDIDATDWSNESTLRQMGYSVKAGGLSDRGRRKILAEAFEAQHLPGLETPEQIKAWGAKKSARRLHAISNFITWLVNFQGAEKPEARKRWLADLDWLKSSYYQKTMSFSWPKASTHTSPAYAPRAVERAQTSNGRTQLSPRAVWPFEDVRAASLSDGATVVRQKMFKPSHTLALMIGEEARRSKESAFKDLMTYIRTRTHQPYLGEKYKSNELMFSLTGEMWLTEEKLRAAVERNMREV